MNRKSEEESGAVVMDMRRWSVVAVVCMVLLSAMGGATVLILSTGEAEAANSGNWYGGEYVITEQTDVHDLTCYSNITIMDGGNLSVTDGTLRMASDGSDGSFLTITVGYGGTLYLDNAAVAAYMNSVDGATPLLAILVENGGQLIMTDGSALRYSGHLVIDNGSLTMYDSVIEGLAVSDIDYYCNATDYPAVNYSYSPVVTVISGDVLMADSGITDVYAGGAVPPEAVDSDYSFVSDDENRDTVTYSLNRYPSSLSGSGTGDLTDLYNDDSSYYDITAAESFIADGFDMAGLLFDSGEATAVLHVLYSTDDAYTGTSDLEVGRDGSYDPVETLGTTKTLVGNEEVQVNATLGNYSSCEYADLSVLIDNQDPTASIHIERVWITVQMDVDAYGNITLMGDTEFTAINSTLGVDFSEGAEHNALTLKDQAQAYLYGVMCEEGTGQPFADAILLEPTTVTLLPLERTADDTTANVGVTSLFSDDATQYTIDDGETMSISINTTGVSGDASSIILKFKSTWGPASSPSNPVVTYIVDGTEHNTDLQPINGDYEDEFILSLDSISDVASLTVEYTSTMNGVQIEYINIEVVSSPQAYLYKWAEINVNNGDQDVEGATVHGIVQGTLDAASYFSGSGESSSPPQEVIDYLGGEGYNVTDSDGMATIPLLVNILEIGDTPTFSYMVLATTETGFGNISAESDVYFSTYPYLSYNSSSAFVEAEIVMTEGAANLSVSPIVVRDSEGNGITSANRTDTVNISFNVSNSGPVPVSDVKVNLYDGDELLGTLTIPYISAWNDEGNRSVTIYYNWTVNSSGSHSINVSVDPDEEIYELDRTDNNASTPMEVSAIAEIDLSDPYMLVNETGTYVLVDVQNVGDNATGDFGMEFFINGVSNVTIPVSNISAGESGRVTLPISPNTSGPLNVTASVVSTDPRLNGTNSTSNLSINLTVELEPSAPVYNVNDDVTVNYTVTNNGVQDAVNVTVNITYTINGGQTFTKLQETISLIVAGGNHMGQLEWPSITPNVGTSTVTYDVTIVVNEDWILPETTYDDNSLSANFTVLDSRQEMTPYVIDSSVNIHELYSYSSIEIVNGGNLSITDGFLYMVSNGATGTYLTITVENGGTLYLNNATIAAYMSNVSEPTPMLAILVENGGQLIMENGSELVFSGHIVIDDGSLTMRDSVIRGMIDSSAEDPIGDIAYFCDGTLYPADTFGYSAVLMIVSSDVLMVNSSIEDIYVGGAAPEGAANSYYEFAKDDGDRTTVTYALNRYVSEFSGGGADLQSLFYEDNDTCSLIAGETLDIEAFDLAGLTFNEGDATVVLHVAYRTDVTFTSADLRLSMDGGSTYSPISTLSSSSDLCYVTYVLDDLSSDDIDDLAVELINGGTDGLHVDRLWLSIEIDVDSYRNITLMGDSNFTAIDSVIPVDHYNEDPLQHKSFVLYDDARAFLYGVTVEEGQGQPFADSIVLIGSSSPIAYVYKWAEVSVSNGVDPVEGALIESYVQYVPSPATYYGPDGESSVPPQVILDYLGGSYNYTDESGKTLVPLLVNTLEVGSISTYTYNINASVESAYGNLSGSAHVDFYPYPYLFEGSNSYVTKPVGITIEDAFADLNVSSFEGRNYSDSITTTVDRTDYLNFTFNITNNGPMPATDFIVYLYDGDYLLQAFNVSYLSSWNDAGNRSVTLYYNWTANTSGSHNITVVMDPIDNVTEIDEDNNLTEVITVTPSAELEIGPADLVYEGEDVYLQVLLSNIGDNATGDLLMDFYVNGTYVGNYSLDLSAGSQDTPRVLFSQGSAGYLDLNVTVLSDNRLLNGTSLSANLSIDLEAETYVLNGFVEQGDPVYVVYNVTNNGAYGAENVTIYINYTEAGGDVHSMEDFVPFIAAGETYSWYLFWDEINPSAGTYTVEYEITIEVNLEQIIPEVSYSDNFDQTSFTVYDYRADLEFSYLSTSDGGSGPQGKSIDILFQVDNIGSSTATTVNVSFYLVGDETVYLTTVMVNDIVAGGNYNGNVSWSVSGDVGNYTIRAVVNENGAIDERNDSNNEMVMAFNITVLEPTISITPNSSQYDVGAVMVIYGTVLNLNNKTEALVNATVVVTIINSQGVVVNTYTAITSSTGTYRVNVPVTEVMSGTSTTISATVTYGGETDTATNLVFITSGLSDSGQPWWIWLVIILAILLMIVAFSIYIYRYSLGKMVECGECHSLIPESAHRCPNCGVDFEVGTAKCSECGAWIPATAKKCPECGASFIGSIISDEEESDYIQLMREGYEAYVDSYRSIAKEELGKKYSDQRFLKWWNDHPDHISFEEWLAKEESSRKEQTFKCPSCGALNAKGSKQCVRCGRSFQRPPSDSPQEEGEEKKIVRRVVRKKKVETPPSPPQTDAQPEEKAVEEAPVLKKRIIRKKTTESPDKEPADDGNDEVKEEEKDEGKDKEGERPQE